MYLNMCYMVSCYVIVLGFVVSGNFICRVLGSTQFCTTMSSPCCGCKHNTLA